MNEKVERVINFTSNNDLGIALLFIFFIGEPDLCDAIIHWLMK